MQVHFIPHTFCTEKPKYISYLKNLHKEIELRVLLLHMLPGLDEQEIALVLLLFCFVFNVQLYRICNICALSCYNASSECQIGPWGDSPGRSKGGKKKRIKAKSLRWEERLLGDLRGATVVTSWNTSKQEKILGFSTGIGTHNRICRMCFSPYWNWVKHTHLFSAHKKHQWLYGYTTESFLHLSQTNV